MEYEKPTDIWHHSFGWILKDGKPTENSAAYYAYLVEVGVVPDLVETVQRELKNYYRNKLLIPPDTF